MGFHPHHSEIAMPHKTPEARREYGFRYRKAKSKFLRTHQPDYARRFSANARARMFGVEGVLTLEDVRRVMSPRKCHYCGTKDALMTIDHKIPMAKGGLNIPENVVPCCRRCNISKGNADRPGRWAQITDCCLKCGTSDRPHLAKGKCGTCYHADWWASKR